MDAGFSTVATTHSSRSPGEWNPEVGYTASDSIR